MCYECGQRKRNFPFKFCEKCYTERRSRDAGPVDGVAVIAPTAVSAVVHNDGVNGNGSGYGAVSFHDDDGAVKNMSELSILSDSDGEQYMFSFQSK